MVWFYRRAGLELMSTSRFMQMAAGFSVPEEAGWNGWDGSWSGSALSGYTTRTDFGSTFGGAYDVAFSDDGTKAFVCGSASGSILKINEWTLSPAYDFTGASQTGSLNPTSSGTYITNLHFNPDGTKLIFVDWSNERLGSFDLSTAWTLSSAGTPSYSTTLIVAAGSVGGTFLTSDATTLFVTNRNSVIREYSFSSAGDVSTLSFVGTTTVGSSNWHGIYFSGDGLTVYLGTRNTLVTAYTLTSPYDLSTAGSAQTLTITTPPDTYGIRLTSLGSQLWVGGGSGSAAEISVFEN